MDPFLSPPSAPLDPQLVSDLFGASSYWSQGRSPAERTKVLVNDLCAVDEVRLRGLGKQSDSCSICLRVFLALLKDAGGVVQLNKDYQCGHLFCRNDIAKWLKDENDTCPICRQELLDPNCVENGPHLSITGGTPRTFEHYRQQGIPFVDTPIGRARTTEERQEELYNLLARSGIISPR